MENNSFEQQDLNNLYQNYVEDKESFIAGIISFFVPAVGVILYFLKRREEPNLARSFRQGVKINLIVSAILLSMYFIFGLYLLFIIAIYGVML